MLVLTRRLDQSLMIGDPANPGTIVEIIVVEVRGDQVRLGITAPKDVAVHRKEVWLQVQAEKAAGTRER